MATQQPPSPDFTVQRSTKGGSGMTPPQPHTTAAPRSASGGKDMSPPSAVAAVRSTSGGKNLTPPSAEVPSSEFVDPIAGRNTPGFKPKKAG